MLTKPDSLARGPSRLRLVEQHSGRIELRRARAFSDDRGGDQSFIIVASGQENALNFDAHLNIAAAHCNGMAVSLRFSDPPGFGQGFPRGIGHDGIALMVDIERAILPLATALRSGMTASTPRRFPTST